MIVDGRGIAKEIAEETTQLLNGRACRVRVISVDPSATTNAYLRIKERAAVAAGVSLVTTELPKDSTTDDIKRAIQEAVEEVIMVQLPLPVPIDTDEVCNAIPVEKDADVLSSRAYELFERGVPGALVPPVAAAVAEILARSAVVSTGKRVVIVGEGRLVGKPCAALLRQMGAHVSLISLEEGSLEDLKAADIVISGAGSPHLITAHHLTPGTVLIDAGASELGERIVGDINPAAAESASVYTPVPGGVGPIAVACLMRNSALLTVRTRQGGAFDEAEG